MPLVLRPGATFRIELDSDKDIPAEKRPYFLARYQSAAETQVALSLKSRFKKKTKPDEVREVIKTICREVSEFIVGWDKIIDRKTGDEISFDPAKLEQVLTWGEINELLAKSQNQGVEIDDLKN